jgi:hypothetical protein
MCRALPESMMKPWSRTDARPERLHRKGTVMLQEFGLGSNRNFDMHQLRHYDLLARSEQRMLLDQVTPKPERPGLFRVSLRLPKFALTRRLLIAPPPSA